MEEDRVGSDVMAAKRSNVVNEERILYKYGLRYRIRYSGADGEYVIEVEIAVQLDPRECFEDVMGVTEEDMPYISLADLSKEVDAITEENEKMVIDDVERQVGALYRKLRNWKRKGRI